MRPGDLVRESQDDVAMCWQRFELVKKLGVTVGQFSGLLGPMNPMVGIVVYVTGVASPVFKGSEIIGILAGVFCYTERCHLETVP